MEATKYRVYGDIFYANEIYINTFLIINIGLYFIKLNFFQSNIYDSNHSFPQTHNIRYFIKPAKSVPITTVMKTLQAEILFFYSQIQLLLQVKK